MPARFHRERHTDLVPSIRFPVVPSVHPHQSRLEQPTLTGSRELVGPDHALGYLETEHLGRAVFDQFHP